jgi:hypothetical protein
MVDNERLGIFVYRYPAFPMVLLFTILALTPPYFPILNILVPHTGHTP